MSQALGDSQAEVARLTALLSRVQALAPEVLQAAQAASSGELCSSADSTLPVGPEPAGCERELSSADESASSGQRDRGGSDPPRRKAVPSGRARPSSATATRSGSKRRTGDGLSAGPRLQSMQVHGSNGGRPASAGPVLSNQAKRSVSSSRAGRVTGWHTPQRAASQKTRFLGSDLQIVATRAHGQSVSSPRFETLLDAKPFVGF